MGAAFDRFVQELLYRFDNGSAASRGSFPRTVGDRLAERVSVTDFMSRLQKRDFRNRFVGRDMSDAVRRAVSALAIGGGVIEFPQGKGYMATPVETGSLMEMRGAGGGTYTVGATTHLVTDSAAGHMFTATGKTHTRFRGLMLQNTNASATGHAISASNATHGRVHDVATLGFAKGLEMVAGSGSCFGWSIYDSEIFGKTFGLDAQSGANLLNLHHVTIGASASGSTGLRFKDSSSLIMGGGCNIEGSSYAQAIDIDATTQGPIGAEINCHFEFGGDPTNAAIRLGATAKVWGINIIPVRFSGASVGVLPLNGSSFNSMGVIADGVIAGGDAALLAAGVFMSDPNRNALAVATNTAVTGAATSIVFGQQNDAGEWLETARIIASATSVANGNEQTTFKLQLLNNGAYFDAMTWIMDSNGVLNTRSEGYLQIKDGVAVPPDSAGYVSVFGASADGDLKAKFGDNFVRVIGADS